MWSAAVKSWAEVTFIHVYLRCGLFSLMISLYGFPSDYHCMLVGIIWVSCIYQGDSDIVAVVS